MNKKEKTSRQRLPALPHMPKVGDHVSFINDGTKSRGTVISCYGRVYVIKCGNVMLAKLLNEDNELV